MTDRSREVTDEALRADPVHNFPARVLIDFFDTTHLALRNRVSAVGGGFACRINQMVPVHQQGVF